MPDLTITVLDEDWPTLQMLAQQKWRAPTQQACALLEQSLKAERARSDPNRRQRNPARRTSARSSSNGAVRVEV